MSQCGNDGQVVVELRNFQLSGFFQFMAGGFMRSDEDGPSLQSIAEAYSALSATPLLASPSLWLGVLAAALLLAAVVRLRRWRDDA